MRHRIGSLTWNRNVIQYIEVDPEWRKKGVGREMLCLAREITPALRHSPCGSRSDDGEAFVRAADPDQACPERIEELPPPIIRTRGPWRRLMRRFLGKRLVNAGTPPTGPLASPVGTRRSAPYKRLTKN